MKKTMIYLNEDKVQVDFICWSDKDPVLLLKVAKELSLDKNMVVDPAIGQVELHDRISYRPRHCQCGVFLRTPVDLKQFWKHVEQKLNGKEPMIIELMFKMPGAFDALYEMNTYHPDLDPESDEYFDIKSKIEDAVRKFVKYGECVTIEIDTDTGTATVKEVNG